MSLTIIVVWYNEKINLPKLFESLKYIESIFSIRKIYIDQSSSDNSLQIAESFGCETYVHANKWYADPDKKWAVEELCEDNDWCLILDADETLSKKLSDEIVVMIQKNEFDIWNIYVESIILGGFWWKAFQMRLFKKDAMELVEVIHEYLRPKSKKIFNLKNSIINNDLKYIWKEINVFAEKLNRYAEIEIYKLDNMTRIFIILNLFWKPLQWFFWFWVIHKQFLRWTRWLILCSLMAYYQFLIYAKLYEKNVITNTQKND
jgi:hypothetical protein